MVIDTDKRYTATMVTSHGTMVIALDPLAAPKTVNSFVFLARYHYYDGVIFHRIIPGFVLQGGDPTGTGTGGPGYKFADELPAPGRYQIGSLAMANAGPNTNGSQFFVISGPDGVAPAAPIRPLRRRGQRGRCRRRHRRPGHPLGQADRDGHHRIGDDRRGRLNRRTHCAVSAVGRRAPRSGRR